MADLCNITEIDIKNLLEIFAKQDYNPKTENSQSKEILDRCIELWKLDYEIEIIPNENGEFCDSYPARIPIPISECGKSFGFDLHNMSFDNEPIPTSDPSSIKSSPHRKKEKDNKKHIDSKQWRNTIVRSNLARCWNRFPVPVLFINGKYISRSATISATIDVGLKYLVTKLTKKSRHNSEEEKIRKHYGSHYESKSTHHMARLDDIKLLKMCEVSSIVDFMVEKKKQKYCLNVSSSEKVDLENRYKDFSLYSMPYPGCEFFKKFSQRNLSSEDLYHSWNDNSWESNEAKINVPEAIANKWSGDWQNYKSWDIRTLTDNYIKVILDLLMNTKEKGLLLHCISGWDRTPLFISLIRLILWGEGTIHSNLSSLQMLYFTLAYDWYLFKHQLNTRINNNEHILYFCFEILSILSIDKVMIPRSRSVSVGSQGSSYEFINLASVMENYNDDDKYKNYKDDDIDGNTEQSIPDSNEWPFAEENDKFSEHWPTYRLSPRERNFNSTSSRHSDNEDDEISIIETSLSPTSKIPLSNSRNSLHTSNGIIDFNDHNVAYHCGELQSETIFQIDSEENVPIKMSSPLPVPGTEQGSANDSFIANSSWSLVTKDLSIKGSSWEGLIKKKDGAVYEKSISSSVGSAQSFLAFDKTKRLKKVRLLFYKLFGEVAVLNKVN